MTCPYEQVFTPPVTRSVTRSVTRGVIRTKGVSWMSQFGSRQVLRGISDRRQQLVPAKLLGGAPLVIVGAAHRALADLGQDALPGDAAPQQVANVVRLLGAVIVVKLQHHRVAFATIHTRMVAQIRQQVGAIAAPLSRVLLPGAGPIGVAMARVVVPKVALSTAPA